MLNYIGPGLFVPSFFFINHHSSIIHPLLLTLFLHPLLLTLFLHTTHMHTQYLKRQNYIRLHPKPFDIVNVSMFTALSILSYFAAPFMEHWLHLAMNLIIFTYFFMSTFIFHQPFTLQFAKEEAPPVLWEEESFVKMNYQVG